MNHFVQTLFAFQIPLPSKDCSLFYVNIAIAISNNLKILFLQCPMIQFSHAEGGWLVKVPNYNGDIWQSNLKVA